MMEDPGKLRVLVTEVDGLLDKCMTFVSRKVAIVLRYLKITRIWRYFKADITF